MTVSKFGRRGFVAGGLALAGTAKLAAPALAQGQTRLNFFYPVAVGGPIAKLIDTLCADFERENPSIKVTPIYTGSYQDTIAKTLTALKSNDFPHFAILLSTDMFTLIDEDVIVPFDDTDQAWIKSFYPAFMENSQAEGKTWGIPFQRSTIVQYWNKELFKEAGLNPDAAPKTWADQIEITQKLTKRDAAGNTVAMGHPDPGVGLPLLAVPGADHAERRAPDEPGRQPHLLRRS